MDAATQLSAVIEPSAIAVGWRVHVTLRDRTIVDRTEPTHLRER